MKSTTFEKEIEFYRGLIKEKMKGYNVPRNKGNLILKILLSHCEEGIKISEEEKAELTRIINQYVSCNASIAISLTMALGMRVPNPLKFKEVVHFPTLAWLHLAFYFSLLNKKVQTVYSPGVKIFIFEEATLFGPWIFGMDIKLIEQMLKICEYFFKELEAPVEIIKLLPEHFPNEEVEQIEVEITPSQVYAIACSLPSMNNEEFMQFLYCKRSRDYDELKKISPKIWKEAEEITRKMMKALTYRKRKKLFQKLLNDIELIDACVTDKNGRIVFDITSPALWNHGMPVVRKNPYKMYIIPEYRIPKEYPEATPIKINSSYPYTFYYLLA
jgi:hypothetical protein